MRGFKKVYTIWKRVGSSVDRLVLSELVLLLGRRGIHLLWNCLWGEDVILEEALLDELFQISSKGPAIDGLMSLAEQYSSDPIDDELGWIGFGRLTRGWSLKALKTSSIGSFNGVKCSADL